MRTGAVASLVLSALAIMGSPGPATISLTASGALHGVRRSLAYLGGIVAGTTVVLLAVASGITATLLAVPGLRPLLLAVAVAYLLRLALHVARAPSLARPETAPAAPTLRGGALLGVANPKAWVAIAAVFASARLADGARADALAKVAVLTLIIVLVNGGWLLAGRALAPLLRDPRHGRAVARTLAGLIVGAVGLTLLR